MTPYPKNTNNTTIKIKYSCEDLQKSLEEVFELEEDKIRLKNNHGMTDLLLIREKDLKPPPIIHMISRTCVRIRLTASIVTQLNI